MDTPPSFFKYVLGDKYKPYIKLRFKTLKFEGVCLSVKSWRDWIGKGFKIEILPAIVVLIAFLPTWCGSIVLILHSIKPIYWYPTNPPPPFATLLAKYTLFISWIANSGIALIGYLISKNKIGKAIIFVGWLLTMIVWFLAWMAVISVILDLPESMM
jgi:hypothetical protein